MSEVILQAVAQALIAQEAVFNQAIDEIRAKVAGIPERGMPRDEVRSLLQDMADVALANDQAIKDIAQDALNKTGLVEQTLRQEICSTVEAFRAEQEKSLGEYAGQIRELSDGISQVHEVNKDTVCLIEIATDKIREELAETEGELKSHIDSLDNDLLGLDQTVGVMVRTVAELGDKVDAQKTKGLDGIGFNTKYWEPSIYRSGSVVQHYLGQVWEAKADTNAEPGTDDTWERLGFAGLRHKGVFDADAVYQTGDLFIKDYGTFLVLDNDRRVMLAGRGTQGKKGDTGPAGTPVTVVSCHSGDNGFVMEMSDGGVHPVTYPDHMVSLSQLKAVAAACEDFAEFKNMLVQL